MSTDSAHAADLPLALTGHAGYLAVLLGQRSQRTFEEAMAPFDLKPIHYDYLATLAEHGPTAQRDLARLLEVDAARIVGLTDALQDRGLVARTVDATDRRRNLVALTRAGRALFARTSKVAARVEDDLLGPLADEKRVQLRSLLRQALSLE